MEQSNPPKHNLTKTAAKVRWNQLQEQDMELQNERNETTPHLMTSGEAGPGTLHSTPMACNTLCQPCGPTPLANSCNEPCALQCQDSRVIINPSPVLGQTMLTSHNPGQTPNPLSDHHKWPQPFVLSPSKDPKGPGYQNPKGKRGTKTPREHRQQESELSAQGQPISGGFGGFGYGLGYGRGFGYGLGGLGCYGRRGGYIC
ncbi:Feather beta keratin [Lonchura striata]|uniref:Keratin n=1 Tax=Lonchura striata TaxID=40157 RepID=A0A218U9C1_9PASE|nr:Feather beta keratin [Lonchura striata domestica]